MSSSGSPPVDWRRVGIYLLITYGISWSVAWVLYRNGGLIDSPQVVPGVLTLATLLLAVAYMPAPAVAHLLTRWITREGWQDLHLRPRLRETWPYWVLAWVGPAVLTVVGGALYFALYPEHFDPSLPTLQEMLRQASEQVGQPLQLPFPLWVLALIQALQAVLLGPLLNGPFAFGEEFGWRAYLQPKLLALGWRRAMLLMGLIWGVWHAPVIAMGHNYGLYGLDYPGAPWSGILAMIGFTFVVGTFLGWLAVRGRSVWPAVIGHAGLNAIAGLPLLFVAGEPNLVLGPLPFGLIGSAGFTLVGLWLFWRGVET